MTLPPIWGEPTNLGFSVFPCAPATKSPALASWAPYQAQRADAAALASWATVASYNVAVACGPVSGVWVLDVDNADAEAALQVLASAEGLPVTLTVRTPRGRHYYWRYPTDAAVGNRIRVGGIDGLDSRGAGGYVMSPGSWYDPTPTEAAQGKVAGQYQWESDPAAVVIADAPEWLLTLVRASNRREYGDLSAYAVAAETSVYGQRALTAEINLLRQAVPGERNQRLNDSTFALAQLVAGGAIVATEAATALREAAQAIGLEDAEIEATLASGWKAGARQPRAGRSLDPETEFAGGVPVVERPTLGPVVSQSPRARDIDDYKRASEIEQYFTGCTWVGDQNRVWTGRDMLDKARFDVVYGGFKFSLDARDEKTTASAWEAFTLSRVVAPATCDGLAFRPLLPSGAVVAEEGRTLLNIWVPIETKRVTGDASRFLDFLARLLPDAGDRAIILAYMASLVQNPGRKFQWWPVVQGTEGNGKSLLLRCLTHAVGSRYTHLPNAPELARNGLKFNGWVTGNLLCGIEEISVGHKRDFLEEFKPIVTNDRVPIERKGVDQVTGDNCLNGMLFTNHRDGVPVTVDTRRYAIFYTAQQCKEDKVRDGMTGGYFPDLYEWLRGEGRYAGLGENYGYAVVAGYLAAYDVPTALDPAGLCVEAPPTSSTASAIVASYGRVEQEIVEAIEQGRDGFAGGWISSIWLDRLLILMRVTVARNKRRDMLRSLGYIPHPALADGRTVGIVKPDDSKPRLYIREGHPFSLITDPAEVAKSYSAAQPGGMVARSFQAVS